MAPRAPAEISNEVQGQFPGHWLTADGFVSALQASAGTHSHGIYEVLFVVPVAAIRLQSLANQLVGPSRRVRLQFDESESDVLSYLYG